MVSACARGKMYLTQDQYFDSILHSISVRIVDQSDDRVINYSLRMAARFVGMSNAALIKLLEAHVPPDQVAGTGPWALCTLCETWQTVSQDKMDQIDREAAEGEGESEWLCCMCTASDQAIGEQGDESVGQTDEEPAEL